MPLYHSTGKMGNMKHTRKLQAFDRYDGVGQNELKRGANEKRVLTQRLEGWRKAETLGWASNVV
jgi:hypothetical protein